MVRASEFEPSSFVGRKSVCVCAHHETGGDIGKEPVWAGTWHHMFWTCHCDVILALGW
jgi:hypothetical protein